MSKKNTVASQKSAAKRNARAKAKSASAAKAKQTPMGVAKRKMRGLQMGNGNMDFDQVLNQALRQAQKGGNGSQPAFNSTEEVMDGIVKAAGETFKLFCYNAVAKELVEQGAIQHTFKADLFEIGSKMLVIDNRVSVLKAYIASPEADESVISTETLDIGTTLQNIADELYNEIMALDAHSLVIEETVARLAAEAPEGEDNERRAKVLTAVAYKLLAEIQLAVMDEHPEQLEAKAAEDKPEIQEDVTGGNNEPVAAQ
uniref:Uncharacterized protein n=1 Tax=Pantoea phage Survivor TaxID=3232176 RepID=A0AAU8L0Y1_9CAUD